MIDKPLSWVHTTGGQKFLRTREASDGHVVVDVFRQGRPAIVVCVKCGATWAEGSDSILPVCV